MKTWIGSESSTIFPEEMGQPPITTIDAGQESCLRDISHVSLGKIPIHEARVGSGI